MDCLQCKRGSRVVDSKKTAQSISRRRECLGCGLRWNTVEYREGRHAKQAQTEPKKPSNPAVKQTMTARRRQREEMCDLREAGYDSDLDDIISDLGVWDDR